MNQVYRALSFPPVTRTLILLPIIGFFVYFFSIRYNILWLDEYENIPYFLDRFLHAPSFGERISALVRPNNEHRVVYARLVVLAQYWLTGRLNFAQLMLWGNMTLLVILFLLYRSLLSRERSVERALLGLLPVPLLLFTAQNHLLTFTALYTLQYLAIIGLAMLTFFILTTTKPLNLGLALGLGLLSTFSMGNGLLVWPAGAGLLIFQRRWTALGIWLLVGLIGGYFYFRGYPVQQGNANGFAYVLTHPLQTVFGFLVFAGSVFDFFPTLPVENRVHLPFIAGLILISILSYWVIKNLFQAKKTPSFFDAFIMAVILFLVANIALVAVFRLRFDFGLALHSSYRTYSLALWATACVLLFSRLSETNRVRVWPLVWGLFLGVSLLTYVTCVPMAIERRKYLQGMAHNQRHTGVGLGGSRDTEFARYIANLTRIMHERGWYDLPDPAITPDEKKLQQPVQAAQPIAPLRVTQTPDYVAIHTDEPAYKTGLNEATYLVMRSHQHAYLMVATRNRPVGFLPWRAAPGLSAGMPSFMLMPGRYQLGLFRTYPDHSDVQYTSQFVDVK